MPHIINENINTVTINWDNCGKNYRQVRTEESSVLYTLHFNLHFSYIVSKIEKIKNKKRVKFALSKLSLPNVYTGKGWDCYKWLRLPETSPFNDPVFFHFQTCQSWIVSSELSHVMWCARDDRKKNLLCISVIYKKRRSKSCFVQWK